MPTSASPRTALVTGADTGLGREVTRLLAAERATVLLHARTREAAEQARTELAGQGCAVDRIVPMGADFTDLAQVAGLAQSVVKDYPRLDLLVNNAGVFGGQTRAVTADSHEVTFQVNYLAPYLLTRLLWPALTANSGSRVVNVSSALHRGGRLHWGDVESVKRYSAVAAYAQSKLALNLFTRAVAVRGGTDLIAVGVHPGVLATDMVRNYTRDTGRPASEGAAAILALANGKVEDGAYYEGVAASIPNTLMEDKSSVDRLWKLSARLVGLAA